MTPTGLENPPLMSPETAQSPVFCGFDGAQDAMFAPRCEGGVRTLVGTPIEQPRELL
jgi:hypothetical protein